VHAICNLQVICLFIEGCLSLGWPFLAVLSFTSLALTPDLPKATYRLFVRTFDRNRVSIDFYDLPINPGHIRVLDPNLGSHRNGSLRCLQEHIDMTTLDTSCICLIWKKMCFAKQNIKCRRSCTPEPS
jgi:hypothetical protein